MKKLSWIVGLFLVAAVAGAQDPVPSINVVGYAKLPQPPGLDLKSAIFYVMSGTNSLQELLGTNGVGGANEQQADTVYLYDTGIGGYRTFFLMTNATIPELNWKWAEYTEDGYVPATVEIWPGTGFWVRNRSTVTNYYSQLGEVELTNEVSITIHPGLQILAYPYAADINVSALSLTNGVAANGQQSADNLFVYVPEFAAWREFFLKADRKWYEYTEDGDVLASLQLKAGQGFWYRSRGGSFQWVEKRPYLNN
jgi:hypothetical protein